MSNESVMPPNHLILCHLFSFCLPSFPASGSFHIGWPKHWSLSFSISPSNEYSGLISFRTDEFDLLAVQGILKSLLQHHRSKALILQCSAFSIVQLSYQYMASRSNFSQQEILVRSEDIFHRHDLGKGCSRQLVSWGQGCCCCISSRTKDSSPGQTAFHTVVEQLTPGAWCWDE